MRKMVQKLTPEIIENCLKLESAAILGRTGAETFNGDGWSEIQSFRSHIVSSEKLRAGIASVVSAIFDEQPEGCDSTDIVADLLESHRVTLRHLQVIEDVCCQFFFLGWHSRGAVDEAE